MSGLSFPDTDRHTGPDGPLSREERGRLMPLEMWAVTGPGWSFGLSHALSCVLLLASLSSNQHTFLPEVWLFARKREQSAPRYHRDASRSVGGVGELLETASFSPRAPWWRRGQGAAVEAAQAEAEESRRAGRLARSHERSHSSGGGNGGSVGGSGRGGWGGGGGSGGGGMGHLARGKRKVLGSPVPEASLQCHEGTHFGRTSRLRRRALRRPGRLGSSGKAAGDEGGGHSGSTSPESCPGDGEGGFPEGGQLRRPLQRQAEPIPPPELERMSPYHLPFTRDAASVVSRFLWKELNDFRVKVVLRAFHALTSSTAAREAGLNPGQVLGALAPARRSMVGSLHTLPMDTMAGILVALAEMFKVPVETLALLAEPAVGQRPPRGEESTPAAEASLPPDTPSPTAQWGAQTTNPASSGAVAAAVTAPAAGTAGGGGSGAALAASEPRPAQVKGGSRLTAAQLRASAVMAAPVREQLELLGDLSQAVGHGEAALVCASLLRDEAGAKNTLRDASQTLRVGYGRFVSDLQGHVENARARAETGMGASTGTGEAGGGTARAARQRAERGEHQPRAEDGTEIEARNGTRTAGDLPNSGGFAGGGPAAGAVSTTRAGTEATALRGFQRFGGECLRSFAKGAVFA